MITATADGPIVHLPGGYIVKEPITIRCRLEDGSWICCWEDVCIRTSDESLMGAMAAMEEVIPEYWDLFHSDIPMSAYLEDCKEVYDRHVGPPPEVAP